MDDLNTKNKLSDSLLALTKETLEMPKAYAEIFPGCISNNPNNDVWDPANATNFIYDNTTGSYQ